MRPHVALAGTLLILSLHSQAPEPPRIHLVGSAELLEGRLRLTRPERQTSGAAWFAQKERVAGGFETTFKFQITEPGGLGPGADGFAFVLQNEGPGAIAGRGSAGGFAIGDGWRDFSKPGIPRSIAVFFDTYRNQDGGDPSDNYIAICTNGPIPKMRWPPNRLGYSKKLSIRLKDGRVHTARIRYKPPIMSVYLDDGEPEVRAPVDISTVVDSNGAAYAGFTASTGNGFENHDILGWSFTPAPEQVTSSLFTVQSEITYQLANCMDGRNLCTPPKALVQETAPGRFHITLPAHLEWGASIPNPDARLVTISNVQGLACWNLKSEEGCGGPDGAADASVDRYELLVPDRNPGALVCVTRQGRTLFSVNGRKGRGFNAHQGFFEFDAQIQQ